MLLYLFGWIIYGLLVGTLAKYLHPGTDEPVGFLPTIGIGMAGSYIGGAVNWLLGFGGSPISSSGIIMGTLGGVVFLAAYKMYLKHNGKKQSGDDTN